MAQKEVHIRISATDQASGQFKKLQATVTQTTSAMQDLRSAMSRALSVTAGLGGFYAIKGLLVDSTKEAFRFAGSLEQTAVGFEAMTGSAKIASAVMGALREMSMEVPIQLEEAQDAARRLLAYGFKAGDVVPVLKTIADAAAGLGLSMQDGGMRIALALGQIKSKGTLQSQEIRQLGEAGIAAWQMLADYLGTTVPDVMDKTQKRMIDSQTALDAILTGMQNKFSGQMEARSRKFMGQLELMGTNFKLAMTETIEPVFNRLRDQVFPSINEQLREFTMVAQRLGLSNAFKTILPEALVDSLTGSFRLLTEHIEELRLAMNALVITISTRLVIGALTPLITKIVMATQTIVALTRAGLGLSFALETTAAGVFNLGKGLVSLIAFLGTTAGLITGLGLGVGYLIGKFWAWKSVLGPVNNELERMNRILEAGPGNVGGASLNGKNGSGEVDVSKEQQLINESRRLDMIEKQRDATLALEQLEAQREAESARGMGGGKAGGSGSGEDKYSKFVQKIKEQARELKLAYEVGRISIEEYTEALDKLAATKGLKDVHSLDLIKQKWEALEPIWKRYQESIDKAEDERLKSYEKGKELIVQWNATEIELERLKAAAKLDIEEETDNASLEAGMMTKEKVLENAIDRENRLYEIEMKALRDRLALGGLDVAGRDAINRQIEELQVSHNLRMVQLEIQLHQQKKTAMSVAQQAYAATNESINDQLVNLPTSLADAFAQAAVGYGSLSDSLKNLAQQLGEAILKAMLLKVLMGWMGGGGMFGGANMSGVMSVLHDGGIVGLEGSRRFVSGLPKFHSGGLSGDEQIAVLQKGEGVFTKKQMQAMGGDQTIVNMTVHAIDAKGVRDFFTTNRGYVEGIVVQSVKRSGAVRSAIKGS